MKKRYLEKFNNYDHLTIVLIGSSITAQDWCHPNWHDWLNYTLKQDENWELCWKRKIINVARDGATINHYIENFDSEIKGFKPDLVIESLGLNSINPILNAEKTKEDLKKLNKMIVENNIELVTWSYLINKPEYFESLKTLRNIQKEVSKELNYQFVDIMVEFEKHDLIKLFDFVYPWHNEVWDIKPGDIDYLHCNVVGNQIIAETLAREVFNTELNSDEFGTMKLINLTEYSK